MSRRHVVVLFAIGTLGCLDCWTLFNIELSGILGCLDCRPLFSIELSTALGCWTLFSTELCSAETLATGPLASKPPTTYRN
jgi:hypothetical protein